MLEPPTGKTVDALQVPDDDGNCGGVMALAISPDRKRAASAGCNGQVVVWDYPARSVIGKPLPIGDRTGPAIRLAFSPNGRHIAVVCGSGVPIESQCVTVCNLESRAVVAGPFKMLGGGLIDGLTFTPDGAILAATFVRRGPGVDEPTSGLQIWTVCAKK